jgi:CDP-glucose 4,6-dehydratase
MIGAWLVKQLLANESRVVALIFDADPQSELIRSGDINRCTVVNGGLEDFLSVERAINLHEVKTVVHLGAQTIVGTAHRFPLPTFEANVRGTYNLLEACRIHSSLVEQVVIASSDKAYGETDSAYTEDMPLRGRHPYEVSKSCADLISQAYFHTYNLPITIARCGNVFGGGDLNWSRIVPGTIRSLLANQAPEIRSDGTFVRDYIYVEDIAGAYVTLAERTHEQGIRGEAFNFSTEIPLSVLDLVRSIQKLMSKDIEPKIINQAKGEIGSQTLKATKARKLLDWKPQTDLEAGLKKTIAWYQEFLKH